MPDTMRSVLTQGAKRYLDGELADEEFARGVFMAIAEAPNTPEAVKDFVWLADQILKE